MTVQEAIDILVGVIATNSEEENEALDMAIEALQKQVTAKLKNPDFSLITDASSNSNEQKSKLDLISRQDAFDAIEEWRVVYDEDTDLIDMIKQLPSAQPEIIRCKDCKHYQGEDSWFHCNRVTWLNGEDDFCSRAERKDNEID